jgi:N-methylhydantoinase A
MRVGIDTGGTFTDFILIEDGQLRIYKHLSDPYQPGRPIVEVLPQLIRSEQMPEIICGTTVATNALLERKGAKTALITTKGFEDILEIGRQNRLKIYDLRVDKPAPLIPKSLRYGIKERVSAQGEIIEELRTTTVEKLLTELKRKGIEALAVCLLFAYTNPTHEQRIAQLAQDKDFFLSLSHQILPEFREYERCSTTVINALVSPKIDQYLSFVENKIKLKQLRIMQSNGGCISAQTTRQEAVRTIFSGPAAGVLGGLELAKLAGYHRIITFDMGGTSTDVALCPGQISYTTETLIAGLPTKIPMIDIHSVGAGGGSLAYVDTGGSLRVGPQSAGANPGPACYGKGGKDLTVTDVNLFLGRLDANSFLGGEKELYPDLVHYPLTILAQKLGLGMEETASGIIKIVNANMERAIRVISIERGYDPRDFSLVAFGGAGPMHACELARDLLIPRVIVPKHPGALSALGLLLADVVKDYSQTILLRSEAINYPQLGVLFSSMEEKAWEEIVAEGFTPEQIFIEKYLDMRYVGQSFELIIPYQANYEEKFHQTHERLYGYCFPDKDIEIVNLRLKVIGKTRKPDIPYLSEGGREPPRSAIIKEKDCYLDNAWEKVPIWKRDRLRPGHSFRGPAIIVEYSSTTVIPPDFSVRVDGYFNLILERLK